MSAERPTGTIVPWRTANASAMVERSSSMMILPLTSAVSGDCAATGRANAANAKTAAGRKPAAARHADRFLIVFLLVAERAVARIERSEIRGRSILMGAPPPGLPGAPPRTPHGTRWPRAH